MELYVMKDDVVQIQLNFKIITLLLMKVDVVQIRYFRLICLLDISVNIFTKVLTNSIS